MRLLTALCLWVVFGANLYSSRAVHRRIDADLKHHCAGRYRSHSLSLHRKTLNYIVMRNAGRKGWVILVAGVHGSEKVPPVLLGNALRTICKSPKNFLIFPILNVHGFDRYRNGRAGYAHKDINRDAQLQRLAETRAFFSIVEKVTRNNIAGFLDIHMTGNVFILPKKKSAGYAKSMSLRSCLLKQGMDLYTRHSNEKGMLMDRFAYMGVPSLIIELGKRGEHLNLTEKFIYKLVKKNLSSFVRSMLLCFP